MKSHKPHILIPALFALMTFGCGSSQDLTDRQAAVAEAGAEVMPFSLEATTHIFTDTNTGGRQDVVADNPADQATIAEIRRHLMEEATKFREGDFSDPEAIHGSAMPGLAALKEGSDRIEVVLIETADGAAITYTTENPDLIQAIHSWFAAQNSDHGSHAEHNS